MINRWKAPITVRHATLEKLCVESDYKAHCPVCPRGLLLVSRSLETFRLLREDYCITCLQRVIYTDFDIGGEPVGEPN